MRRRLETPSVAWLTALNCGKRSPVTMRTRMNSRTERSPRPANLRHRAFISRRQGADKSETFLVHVETDRVEKTCLSTGQGYWSPGHRTTGPYLGTYLSRVQAGFDRS